MRADEPGDLVDIPAYNHASSQRAAKHVEFHSVLSAKPSDQSTGAMPTDAPSYCQRCKGQVPRRVARRELARTGTSGRYRKSSRNARNPLEWMLPIRFVRIATIMSPISIRAQSGVSSPSMSPAPQANSTRETKSALARGNGICD